MNWFHVYLCSAFCVEVSLVCLIVIDDEIRIDLRKGRYRWWEFIAAAILLGAIWPITLAIGAWRDLRGKSQRKG